MTILFDNIIYSLQKAGGISNYWMEVSNYFIRKEESGNLKCFFLERNDARKNLFRSMLDIPEDSIVKDVRLPVKIGRYLSVKSRIPQQVIFHSSYYRTPLSGKGITQIVTVHDFIYEYYRSGVQKYVHKAQKLLALEKADGIICVSENTKTDLLKLYPRFEKKKINVIYNGVAASFYPMPLEKKDGLRQLLGSENKYAIFIGDRIFYKNFDFATELVKQIKTLSLVIVGGKELNNDEINLLNETKISYVHLMHISNEDLNLLYNFAEFLIYPSDYEGFGIPIIEAMKAGCPVLALKKSSIAEIAEGYSLLLERKSVEEGLDKITYLNNNRHLIRESGHKIASKYSWEKCGADTYSFYDNILSMK